MKTLIAFVLLAVSLPGVACEGELLDQDFRRLASTEEVNLCEAYSDKVLLIVDANLVSAIELALGE